MASFQGLYARVWLSYRSQKLELKLTVLKGG